jgi:hypothetical protein
MKMLEGPWHEGFGVTITMPAKLGQHVIVDTVTIVGGKDTVEGIAAYLTGKTHEAKPMAAGVPVDFNHRFDR